MGVTNQQTKYYRSCARQLENTIFSYLPSRFHGDYSNIHYKNIFCLFYDKEKKSRTFFKTNLKNGVTLWDFEISCDTYIPVYYHVSLERFIRFAQNNGCNIYLKPLGDECGRNMNNNKCNTSGNLLIEDPDITWTCEHLNVPSGRRNEFWIMFNPMDKTTRFISTCNVTVYGTRMMIRLRNTAYKCHWSRIMCHIKTYVIGNAMVLRNITSQTNLVLLPQLVCKTPTILSVTPT